MTLQEIIRTYKPVCEQEENDQKLMLKYMTLFDDLLYRENEMAHFTASAWIVNPSHTHALMAYHKIYDAWAWTGGHADGSEDLLAVALKEAKEETSLNIVQPLLTRPISLEILPVNPHFKRGKFVSPHLHLNLTYLLQADDTQSIQAKADENKAVQWFSLEEAVTASREKDMHPIYRKLNSVVYAL